MAPIRSKQSCLSILQLLNQPSSLKFYLLIQSVSLRFPSLMRNLSNLNLSQTSCPQVLPVRLDLPDATSPIIQTNSPCFIYRSISFNVISLFSFLGVSTIYILPFFDFFSFFTLTSFLPGRVQVNVPSISIDGLPQVGSSLLTNPFCTSGSMRKF